MKLHSKQILFGLANALVLIFLCPSAHAVPMVNLGTASGFSILAGSKITDAGGSSTVVAGNVGLYPTTGAAIGLTAGQVVGGTIYSAETSGALLNGAQNDLTNAYNDAASRPVTVDFGVVDNQLGSSATIGTCSDFVGNIMADQSIALQAYATLDGSALARIAAVSLDHNTITVSDCTVADSGGDHTGGSGNSVPDPASTFSCCHRQWWDCSLLANQRGHRCDPNP